MNAKQSTALKDNRDDDADCCIEKAVPGLDDPLKSAGISDGETPALELAIADGSK